MEFITRSKIDGNAISPCNAQSPRDKQAIAESYNAACNWEAAHAWEMAAFGDLQSQYEASMPRVPSRWRDGLPI